MQGFPPKQDYPPFPPSPNNPSNKGAIVEFVDLELGSVAHPNHQLKGVFETLEEGFLSSANPPLTDPIGPTLVGLPSSTCHFDHFTAYRQQYWDMETNHIFDTSPILPITTQS